MVIKESKIEISISKKCTILGVNRSSYYKWCNRKNNYDDTVVRLVIEIDNYLVKSTLSKVDFTGVKIMHSDQDVQFTSNMYSQELIKYSSVSISMSHVGECYDNAQMKSIFGHIKDDFYIFYNPKSEEELLENMNEYINYYNNERIQMRLKMSPVMYRTHHSSLD